MKKILTALAILIFGLGIVLAVLKALGKLDD